MQDKFLLEAKNKISDTEIVKGKGYSKAFRALKGSPENVGFV